MGRGTGRKRRLKVVDGLETSDPALASELEELRRYSPQAYRKRLRSMDRSVMIGGIGVIPSPHPGRETDPALALSNRSPIELASVPSSSSSKKKP